MPTLILTPRYSEDAQLLWKAASQLNWPIARLQSWQIPAELKHVDEPVLYCEALFGPTLAAELGISLLEPSEDWLTRLPYAYRQRQIHLSTLGDARRNPLPAFVKPPNDKSFPAQVYLGTGLPQGYDDAMSVLVSDIVHWEKEFRCFILQRKLVTFSIYSRDGHTQRDTGFVSTEEEDRELIQFVNRLLEDETVPLPDATVVDVGVIAGRGWACVEKNAAWGAGMYGCEPRLVLEVIQHTVQKTK
ncbi:MAG: ATP-grasp domain-containing protein [Burkholderiales bacterium]|nr:ATP-grasp domain-containing protein [Burkholderiales bacterium]